VRVLTGLLQGVTTGAPLTMVIDNTDTDSSTYERFRRVPRPGHADHTAKVRYGGFNDHRGGGMFSGRLTAALVMGGAVAQQALQSHGITIAAHVADVGGIAAPSLVFDEIAAGADRSDCRCAHGPTAERIEEAARTENRAAVRGCVTDFEREQARLVECLRAETGERQGHSSHQP